MITFGNNVVSRFEHAGVHGRGTNYYSTRGSAQTKEYI